MRVKEAIDNYQLITIQLVDAEYSPYSQYLDHSPGMVQFDILSSPIITIIRKMIFIVIIVGSLLSSSILLVTSLLPSTDTWL